MYKKDQSHLLRRLRSYEVSSLTYDDTVVASAVCNAIMCKGSGVTDRDKLVRRTSSFLDCPLDKLRN